MLDQNTDRLWYVIGAVLVGAALILSANTFFPTAFASVGSSFQNALHLYASPEATFSDENIVMADDLTVSRHYGSDLVDYDESTGTWTIDVKPGASKFSGGLDVKNGGVLIPYGSAYRLSYEVLAPVALSAHNDIDNTPTERSDHFGKRGVNDNDKMIWRRHSYNRSVPNEWTKMSYTYYNQHEDNTDEVGLYDNSEFGLVNNTDEVVQIKIRKVKAQLGTY